MRSTFIQSALGITTKEQKASQQILADALDAAALLEKERKYEDAAAVMRYATFNESVMPDEKVRALVALTKYMNVSAPDRRDYTFIAKQIRELEQVGVAPKKLESIRVVGKENLNIALGTLPLDLEERLLATHR